MTRPLTAAALLVLMTAGGCSRDGASSPREALVGLAQAFQEGDYLKASARLVRPEYAPGIKLTGALLAAQRKVEDALIARFGKESGEIGTGKQLARLVEEAKTTEMKVEGDDATAMLNGQPNHMKRYDGRWYYEPRDAAPSLRVAEISVQYADALKKAGDEMASEIAAGKFNDAGAAKQDWGRRLATMFNDYRAKAAAPIP